MQAFNIHAAKTNLSRLIDQVAAGEEIVIARAGKPVARLVPMEPGHKRVLGILGGTLGMSDDFLTPDPEMQALFEGD
jgi:prevent-host-death family protein